MSSKSASPGSLLLLEGPTKNAWKGAESDAGAHLDALPYFDKEYEEPSVRTEVNRLVQEEMRRSRKRPADYLARLPRVPPLNPDSCPMLAREAERVRAGRPPASGVDQSRYECKAPVPARASDPAAWRSSVHTACCALQHLDLRRANLELLLQHGPNAWRMHNQHLEAFLARMQISVAELKGQIELVNRDRKLNQQAAAGELSRLNKEWAEGVRKNFEIESACGKLQTDIALLHQKAKALGLNMEPQQQEAS